MLLGRPRSTSALTSGKGHRLYDDFGRVRRDELRFEGLARIRQRLDDVERRLSQLAEGGS
jgi:hypothetical protein